MKRNRHKRKSTFTVMVIANRADGRTHRFRMSHIVIPIVACSLVCVVIFCVAFTMSYPYLYSELPKNTFKSNIDSKDYEQLKNKNAELASENAELEEKVSFLSNIVKKYEADEIEKSAKSIPTGYPLDGTASLDYYGVVEHPEEQQDEDGGEPDENLQGNQEQEIEQEEANQIVVSDENPEMIVIFTAGAGTSVIASGNGVIRSVTEDSEYGYRVEIDHGNGYVSIYRNKSEPKVKEGSEIARGTIIFELSDSQSVGYQIILDDFYIDPMEIMEIFG